MSKKNKAAVATSEVQASAEPKSGVTVTFVANPEKMPRGQRAVILAYLTEHPTVTFTKLVEDLYPAYLKLINSYALEHQGGVAGSIRYHLRHLARGGNVTVEGTVPLAPRTPRAARLPIAA